MGTLDKEGCHTSVHSDEYYILLPVLRTLHIAAKLGAELAPNATCLREQELEVIVQLVVAMMELFSLSLLSHPAF